MTNDELRALIAKHPPMTDEQREEQIVSFVWGNLNTDRDEKDWISKEQVRAIVKARKK